MEKPKSKSTIKYIVELAEIILIAFALSWVLRAFVIEARQVPTGSMLPTIQLDDRLIVDKLFFKHLGKIKHGDVLVFRPPPEAHATDDYIKRVVGLPGDKVEIRDHVTYVDDQPLNEPYLMENARMDYGPIYVPENSLFVMGDNRNNSADSREWGFLPMENVTGRTLFRYWPLKNIGALAR